MKVIALGNKKVALEEKKKDSKEQKNFSQTFLQLLLVCRRTLSHTDHGIHLFWLLLSAKLTNKCVQNHFNLSETTYSICTHRIAIQCAIALNMILLTFNI